MAAYPDILDALGDPTRREIFETLRRGPETPTRLAGRLPVSRPAVSQHLRVLEHAGLVTHTSRGTSNLYEIAPDGLAELRNWVDGFWDDALERFKQVAEQKARKR